LLDSGADIASPDENLLPLSERHTDDIGRVDLLAVLNLSRLGANLIGDNLPPANGDWPEPPRLASHRATIARVGVAQHRCQKDAERQQAAEQCRAA
jgi:hypothetical protein